jgi:hypothetical protein
MYLSNICRLSQQRQLPIPSDAMLPLAHGRDYRRTMHNQGRMPGLQQGPIADIAKHPDGQIPRYLKRL